LRKRCPCRKHLCENDFIALWPCGFGCTVNRFSVLNRNRTCFVAFSSANSHSTVFSKSCSQTLWAMVASQGPKYSGVFQTLSCDFTRLITVSVYLLLVHSRTMKMNVFLLRILMYNLTRYLFQISGTNLRQQSLSFAFMRSPLIQRNA
jgi:hypothetical protein